MSIRGQCAIVGIGQTPFTRGTRVEVHFEELPGQGVMPRFRVVDA